MHEAQKTNGSAKKEVPTSGYLRLTERWQQALVYDVLKELGVEPYTKLVSYLLKEINLNTLRDSLSEQDKTYIKTLVKEKGYSLLI